MDIELEKKDTPAAFDSTGNSLDDYAYGSTFDRVVHDLAKCQEYERAKPLKHDLGIWTIYDEMWLTIYRNRQLEAMAHYSLYSLAQEHACCDP
jgi:hypothetical protein